MQTWSQPDRVARSSTPASRLEHSASHSSVAATTSRALSTSTSLTHWVKQPREPLLPAYRTSVPETVSHQPEPRCPRRNADLAGVSQSPEGGPEEVGTPSEPVRLLDRERLDHRVHRAGIEQQRADELDERGPPHRLRRLPGPDMEPPGCRIAAVVVVSGVDHLDEGAESAGREEQRADDEGDADRSPVHELDGARSGATYLDLARVRRRARPQTVCCASSRETHR